LNWKKTRHHRNLTNQILVFITNQNKCKIDYINGQFEKCPDTQKVHLQVCIIAEKPLTQEHWKIFVKGIFNNHCHVQTRKHGNSAAARDYCRKNTGVAGDRIPGTEPFEYGEFRDTEVVSGGQGSRSDVSELRAWMKENPESTFQHAQDTFMGTPSLHTLITQKNWFLQEMNEYNSVKIKDAQKVYFEGLTLRPWQQEILNIVSLSPTLGDRTIHIVVDPCGNSGKSLVSSLVSTLHGMQCLSIGKRDDILYAFRQSCPSFTGVRGVVIDTPMSAGTTGHDSRISVWQAAELLKGFQLVINKYASVIRSLPPLHVVIMTNQPVPPGVFGEKRARIHELKHTDLGIQMVSSWYDHTATATPPIPNQYY
tara:strand:+ start:510 stop:1610 length:1101 start_codon:yes stop_codon:yes gene_type:complete